MWRHAGDGPADGVKITPAVSARGTRGRTGRGCVIITVHSHTIFADRWK